MKRIFLASAFVVSAVTLPVQAAVNVAVSVGEPGFYGVIDIGNAPHLWSIALNRL